LASVARICNLQHKEVAVSCNHTHAQKNSYEFHVTTGPKQSAPGYNPATLDFGPAPCNSLFGEEQVNRDPHPKPGFEQSRK
jgi:hypothetical protein